MWNRRENLRCKSEGALSPCALGFVVFHTALHILCSHLIESTFTPKKALYTSITVLSDYSIPVFAKNTFNHSNTPVSRADK